MTEATVTCSHMEHAVKIAVMQTQIVERKEADDFRNQVVEQRLTELNHQRAQDVSRQAHYVSMDKFDGFLERFDASLRENAIWRTHIDKTLAANAGFSGGTGSSRASLFQTLAISISAAILLVMAGTSMFSRANSPAPVLVVDPAIAELRADVKSLLREQAESAARE